MPTTVITSRTAAPAVLVTIATVVASAGMGRLRAGSKRPSRWSASLTRSSSRWAAPIAEVGIMRVTLSWNSPFDS